MTGLTKEDVIKRVGKPTSTPEARAGDIWIYQIGMSPDATITFENKKVSEVWTAYEEGFIRL
ncbi:MAG TPA: hypothetical protein VIT23_08595 [Terrimicrobiaceae bacterium]